MESKALVLLLIAMWAAPLAAQTSEVTSPPPNFVIPNDNGVPAGPFGGLESVAYAARTSDPSAAWFNPAGLSYEQGAQISGSAGIYQLTRVLPQALPNQGGSLQQVPNSVGFTVRASDRLTLGAALITTADWAQDTDSQVVNAIGLGDQRFALSADSEFSRRVIAASAGYRLAGGWRVGGGIGVEYTSINAAQTISDRIADSTTLRTLLVTSHASGSALQLRAVVGAQYGQSSLRAGVAVRTPAATVTRSGTIVRDGTLDSGASALGASLFDADAHFEASLPWEFHGGVAYVGSRAQIEADIQAYTPTDRYVVLSTDQPTVIYGDTGAASPPIVFTQPFSELRASARGFANGAVGGQIRLLRNRELRLHGGVATDRSPLTPDSDILGRINFLSWTIGVSGQLGKFQFAGGVNRRTGTSDDITVQNLIGGRVVQTPFDVHATGFIYSLAYQF